MTLRFLLPALRDFAPFGLVSFPVQISGHPHDARFDISLCRTTSPATRLFCSDKRDSRKKFVVR